MTKEQIKHSSIVNNFLTSKIGTNFRNFYNCYRSPLPMLIQGRKILKQYKGAYEGQRCFIIGNGPSLTPEDLGLLKGEVCFAANRIYEIYPFTDWRPTFYCVQDNKVSDLVAPHADIPILSSQQTFFRALTYDMKRDKYEKYAKHIAVVPIMSQPAEAREDLSKRRFTMDADQYIYDGDTVTYMSMELAAYMGFSHIYLLGVDATFPRVRDKDGNLVENDNSKRAHFYETVEDNFQRQSELSYMPRDIQFAAYQAAEDFSRCTGKFRIYNATRGGELEIFERVSFDSLMHK